MKKTYQYKLIFKKLLTTVDKCLPLIVVPPHSIEVNYNYNVYDVHLHYELLKAYT
jgi:hypothetical protein